MYRLNLQREFGNLFSIKNGCPLLEAGIGNISFVKDLMTEAVVTNSFKCSKFGQHVHPRLGWVIFVLVLLFLYYLTSQFATINVCLKSLLVDLQANCRMRSRSQNKIKQVRL